MAPTIFPTIISGTEFIRKLIGEDSKLDRTTGRGSDQTASFGFPVENDASLEEESTFTLYANHALILALNY